LAQTQTHTHTHTHTHTNLAECVRKELQQVVAICDICLQSAHPVTLHYIRFSRHSVSEHLSSPSEIILNTGFRHTVLQQTEPSLTRFDISHETSEAERITVNLLSSLRRLLTPFLVYLRCSLQAS